MFDEMKALLSSQVLTNISQMVCEWAQESNIGQDKEDKSKHGTKEKERERIPLIALFIWALAEHR